MFVDTFVSAVQPLKAACQERERDVQPASNVKISPSVYVSLTGPEASLLMSHQLT